jgi:hypothetical protein
MPQRDVYHDAVKQALIDAGCTVTHEPYYLLVIDVLQRRISEWRA